jgi:uncharacterized metal-binding protein
MNDAPAADSQSEPLACADRLLAEHGVTVTSSIQLENRGILKAKHEAVARDDSERIYEEIMDELVPVLASTTTSRTN